MSDQTQEEINDVIVTSLLLLLTDEQKQKLIDLVRVGRKQEPSPLAKIERETPSKPRVVVNEDFRVIKPEEKANGRTVARFNKNQWSDTGEHRDVETPEYEATPRNRKPPEKVDLECYVCGRQFKQHAGTVYGDFHRCNRCTGKG